MRSGCRVASGRVVSSLVLERARRVLHRDGLALRFDGPLARVDTLAQLTARLGLLQRPVERTLTPSTYLSDGGTGRA